MTVRSTLIATDSDLLYGDLNAALTDGSVSCPRASRGQQVLDIVNAGGISTVVVDAQVDNMGAFAITRLLRMEQEAGRAPRVRIVQILDRDVDRFLAQKSGADDILVKPLNELALIAAVGG